MNFDLDYAYLTREVIALTNGNAKQKRKNYKKFNEIGLDGEMTDVLDISDPSSDMFDGEADALRDQIDIMQTEQEIERDKEAFTRIYEQQGAKPKTKLKGSSTPQDELKVGESSAPQDTRQVLKSDDKGLAKQNRR